MGRGFVAGPLTRIDVVDKRWSILIDAERDA
jgi:hypothetical protein